MASTISAGTTSGTAIAIAGDTTGALALQTNNGTTAVTIDTSQNVGIGNTAPADRLQIEKASANCLLSVSRTTGGAGGRLVMQHTDSVGALQTTASVPLTFGTNDLERMRITSDGNVLIGTTTANARFTAKRTTAGDVCGFQNGSDAGYGMTFYNVAGTYAGYISWTATTTNYVTSSDYRLKENITPMTGALSKVIQLKPVTYNWKVDGSSGQGFIAHELKAVVPECVTGEKDEVDAEGNPVHQGVDTSFLVATLTAAIQELNAKVDAQAATIAELQARTT